MLDTLLRAKLHRPAPAPSALRRPRLLRRLDEGLSCKMTLVSAPAGFGKSTLVSSWIDTLLAPAPVRKVSWLSLDEADDQLPRFLRYLAAAIEEHFPQSCQPVTIVLQEKPPPTVEILADLLVDRLSLLPEQLVLVLDDLHLINDAAVYLFLTRLIQHAPAQFHLVLITRVDPPLPLSRWRAQGRMNELRHHDLGFNLDETDAFLQANLAMVPAAAIVTTLHECTEGWVVGLRLASLALRNESNYSAVVAGFAANSNRYVIDYLMDDVLDHQPAGVQQFLICTAILNRFCPALCAAVLESDEAEAQQHINHVTRANLFLIELSAPAYWYRYHHQFQNMLLSKLHERYSEQAIALMHRQAATWLAAHDQVDEALRHLTAIADFAAAGELVESQRLAALNELRFDDLENWLNILPASLLYQRPALLISLAWVHFDQLDTVQCLAMVQRGTLLLHEQAHTLSPVTHHLLQAELVALHTALDRALEPREALGLIRQSWTPLRSLLTYTHCNVPLWLAYTAQRMGDLELGLTIVLTTLNETMVWPPLARGRLQHTAGFFYWCGGDLAQAERTFLENLRMAGQYQLHPIAIMSHHGLGAVADARNQLELAESHHLAVVMHPHITNGQEAVMDLYRLIGVYAQRGQPEEARSLVERLKKHALLMGRPYLINQVAGFEAYLALVCGDLTAALRWALGGSRTEMYNGADRIPLIRARILLAEGTTASLHVASQLLQELSHRHEAEHAWHRAVDVQVLLALTWAKLGQMEPALLALGRAVQRAVPNGMVGPFIEQGEAMEPLLQELGKRPEFADLARLLLASFPGERIPPRAVPVQPLPEPLTDRELEILQLLAGRLSNKEIAHQLTVSPYTVRNHTANIFGKLQVENRHEAVERARGLGLLPSVSQRPAQAAQLH